jgi:hypothetical protein
VLGATPPDTQLSPKEQDRQHNSGERSVPPFNKRLLYHERALGERLRERLAEEVRDRLMYERSYDEVTAAEGRLRPKALALRRLQPTGELDRNIPRRYEGFFLPPEKLRTEQGDLHEHRQSSDPSHDPSIAKQLLETSSQRATLLSDSVAAEWIANYVSGDFSLDVATAVALDDSGNVYVTGQSYGSGYGSGSDYDYATVKYNASGVEQWVARYDGPGNYSDDYATAIAVDGAGNVYVTGISANDYATVKYNASGIQQWVARYDGPGYYYDRATAIAVDGAGNVYVTGYSYDFGTDYDYATVKYNASGVQ